MDNSASGKIRLFYATQTGQSKAIAEEMCCMAVSKGIDIEALCMSTIGKDFLLGKESHMLFVASTTGDGDPPDVATKFWRSLKKSKEDLTNTSYALLGLGDTNYTNFCNFGKMLDKRLKEMNAKPFFPSMWADDAIGLESVAKIWMEGTLNKLLEILDVKQGLSVSQMPTQSEEKLITSTVSLSIGDDRPVELNISSVLVSNNSPNQGIPPISDNDYKDLSQPILTNGFSIKKDHPISELFQFSVEDFEHLQLPSLPARIVEISPSSVELNKNEATYPHYFKETNNFFLPSSRTDLRLATLKNASNLTEGKVEVKKILSMEFDISECSWSGDIMPGDTVGIVCPNDKSEVDELLMRLNLTESKFHEAEFKVIDAAMAKKKKTAMLEKCRIIDILMWHMDIRSIPKKAFLRSLAEVTKRQEEQQVLEVLSSQQGSEHYNRIFLELRITVIDLLRLLPSCSPSIGLLYEHLPKLLPRPYSICNSPLLRKEIISVVFSLSEYQANDITHLQISSEENFNSISRLDFTKMGICTGWLFGLYKIWKSASNTKIPVAMYLRKPTQFRLPEDVSVPLVLIGTGTGISPFIGFLQHRLNDLKSNGTKIFGETWLFFGCRGQNDFIFREELVEFKASGVLNHTQVCFSRESNFTGPRYVQDGMILHGAALTSLLKNTCAKIYICGDARKLTVAVRSALKIILQNNTDLTEKETDEFYNELRVSKRIIEDVWI